MLEGVTQKYCEMISKKDCKRFYETTKICFAKILKGVMKISWVVLCKTTERCYEKHWKSSAIVLICVCKATKKFSTKIQRAVLHKYREVLSKNIDRCSTNLLRWVLHSDTKMNNLLVKTQVLALFPVFIMAFYFWRPKVKK